MNKFQLFVEFFQRVTKSRLTPVQEKVASMILREAGEFIAVGTGKTTLFDMLEAYADHENADYVTRSELVNENEELSKLLSVAQAEIEKLKANLSAATKAPAPVEPKKE